MGNCHYGLVVEIPKSLQSARPSWRCAWTKNRSPGTTVHHADPLEDWINSKLGTECRRENTVIFSFANSGWNLPKPMSWRKVSLIHEPGPCRPVPEIWPTSASWPSRKPNHTRAVQRITNGRVLAQKDWLLNFLFQDFSWYTGNVPLSFRLGRAGKSSGGAECIQVQRTFSEISKGPCICVGEVTGAPFIFKDDQKGRLKWVLKREFLVCIYELLNWNQLKSVMIEFRSACLNKSFNYSADGERRIYYRWDCCENH